jgi:hypothetical protein
MVYVSTAIMDPPTVLSESKKANEPLTTVQAQCFYIALTTLAVFILTGKILHRWRTENADG